MNQDLSGNSPIYRGFQNADCHHSPGDLAAYLALVGSLPSIHRYKHRSHMLLGEKLGTRVLELGCGIGDDARELAQMVGPGGKVVAVDRSYEMIERARSLTPPILAGNLEFCIANGSALPFERGSFDSARIDRTLQHADSPPAIIAEMTRVLGRDGRVVLCEPDWVSFEVTSLSAATDEVMRGVFYGTVRNPEVGSLLPHIMAAAGLRSLQVEQDTMVFRNYQDANTIFRLEEVSAAAVEAGVLSPADRDGWLADLKERSASTAFSLSFTLHIVAGVKG